MEHIFTENQYVGLYEGSKDNPNDNLIKLGDITTLMIIKIC